VPEEQTISTYAKDHKLPGAGVNDWAHHPKVKEAILKDLSKIATRFRLSSYERPRDIFVDGTAFSVENGLLTPEFRVIRENARDHYQPQIAELAETCNQHDMAAANYSSSARRASHPLPFASTQPPVHRQSLDLQTTRLPIGGKKPFVESVTTVTTTTTTTTQPPPETQPQLRQQSDPYSSPEESEDDSEGEDGPESPSGQDLPKTPEQTPVETVSSLERLKAEEHQAKVQSQLQAMIASELDEFETTAVAPADSEAQASVFVPSPQAKSSQSQMSN